MRAGGCTVQQALSNDAATVIKQAVTLARRRGHAQVTPLHVASTMLSSSSGLLRTACLQSHSHPLQCKALELCFNVALNRLPTASSASPLLGHSYSHHPHPSISKALIAAFKRAQAHQRRGSSADNQQQQQQIFAVKIELEQLIISILDDPSVSRVMREADFSSTEVKSNVEQAVISLEICFKTKESDCLSSQAANKQITNSSSLDVSKVIEHMISNKKRNTVVVGELADSVESVIQGVKVKLEKGDVPDVLRDVKFTALPLHTLPSLSKEEVDQKLGEIRSFVRDSHFTKKGLILFIGDLKWVADSWTKGTTTDHHGLMRNKIYPYPNVEHIVMELGKLAACSARFWIMGAATFQNYMRCRDGRPSVQSLLDLQAVTISADNSLALSLNTDSESHSLSRSTNTCVHSRSTASSSSLPKWLQQCKNDIKKPTTLDQHMQECIPVTDLCKKWKSMSSTLLFDKQQNKSDDQCSSIDKTTIFSSILSPSSSTNNNAATFSIDHHIRSSCYQPTHRKVRPPDSKSNNNNGFVFISDHTDPFSPNPILSSSCNDAFETDPVVGKFEEVNVDTLKKICSALEVKVPWQKDIIPEIASTVLQCRSGMMKKKGKIQNIEERKRDTWLYFQGVDIDGKERIARELARVMFGSYTKFVSISLSNFSSPWADSSEDLAGNKRARDKQISGSYVERFGEEVSSDPHRVFLVEDVEQADFCSQLGIKKAIESGRVTTSTFQEVSLCDAIVILSCESYSSRSRVSSPSQKPKVHDGHQDKNDVSCLNLEATRPCVSLDLDLNISMDDDGCIEDQSADEIGILDSVDKRVVFKLNRDFNG